MPALYATAATTDTGSRKVKPTAKNATHISDEQQRRFNTFYLEAVVQREKATPTPLTTFCGMHSR